MEEKTKEEVKITPDVDADVAIKEPKKPRSRKKVAAVEEKPDARSVLERFIDTATAQTRRLNRDKLNAEREGAVAQLQVMYGEFTPETVVNITDVVHRFIVLAEMARGAWHHHVEMDKLRRDRRTAIQVLRRHYNWKPVKISRLLPEECDRRVVDFADAVGDIRTVPDMSEEAAKRMLVRAQEKYMKREQYGEFARPKRDELILAMTQGKAGGKVWTNAELSRLGKMTSAAIAQIRNGTAPSAKRAARAA